jgi:hypothetical protein
VFNYSNRLSGQKLLVRERFVSWSIVTVENPIGGPKLRPFSRHSIQTGSGADAASYPMGNGEFSPREKRPGRETGHSPPSSTEVKNAWPYTSTPQHILVAWFSVKQRDKFILPLQLHVTTSVHVFPHNKFSSLFGFVEWIQIQRYQWYRRKWWALSSFVSWIVGMSAVSIAHSVVCFCDHNESTMHHFLPNFT